MLTIVHINKKKREREGEKTSAHQSVGDSPCKNLRVAQSTES